MRCMAFDLAKDKLKKDIEQLNLLNEYFNQIKNKLNEAKDHLSNAVQDFDNGGHLIEENSKNTFTIDKFPSCNSTLSDAVTCTNNIINKLQEDIRKYSEMLKDIE